MQRNVAIAVSAGAGLLATLGAGVVAFMLRRRRSGGGATMPVLPPLNAPGQPGGNQLSMWSRQIKENTRAQKSLKRNGVGWKKLADENLRLQNNINNYIQRRQGIMPGNVSSERTPSHQTSSSDHSRPRIEGTPHSTALLLPMHLEKLATLKSNLKKLQRKRQIEETKQDILFVELAIENLQRGTNH